MTDRDSGSGEWVMLTYRLPREPSAPRLALWRKLKRLGVAQLADGLVALPADARTREQLEWAAEEVEEAGGAAGVWLARPSTSALERDVAARMNEARAQEFAEIADQARGALDAPSGDRVAALRRLRAQMRRMERRDYFRPPEREQARQALRELAQHEVAQHDQTQVATWPGHGVRA
ncbi:Chromate resistance protein ChrB [Actinopolymorpha sp. NPDC004070]|uniref:Chromate resistance protein ChrB n=1 Tax=Actinopolymorpha sp. NPDC004070 TaxID=3154548 RepID=UPI0033A68FB9